MKGSSVLKASQRACRGTGLAPAVGAQAASIVTLLA
jgi:hypothetical protein